MRIRSLCYWYLVWACFLAGSILATPLQASPAIPARADNIDLIDRESLGACSFCSTNLSGLNNLQPADWTAWPPVPFGMHSESSLSHHDNLLVRSAQKIAKKKTVPKQLSSVGFATKSVSPASSNWNFPAYVPTASWNLNYEAKVVAFGKVHAIKSLKTNVKPITVKAVINTVGRSIEKAANSSQALKWFNAVDLDRRWLELVGAAQELSDRWVNGPIASYAELGEALQAEAVFANLVVMFRPLESVWGSHEDEVQIQLPARLRGDVYWQYYGDCDRWNVLINTALDSQTFEEQGVEEPKDDSAASVGVAADIPRLIVSFASLLGGYDLTGLIPQAADLIRQARFCATESAIQEFEQFNGRY